MAGFRGFRPDREPEVLSPEERRANERAVFDARVASIEAERASVAARLERDRSDLAAAERRLADPEVSEHHKRGLRRRRVDLEERIAHHETRIPHIDDELAKLRKRGPIHR